MESSHCPKMYYFKKNDLFSYFMGLCSSVCGSVHGILLPKEEGQVSDPAWELELQVVVNQSMEALGTELRSSARTANALP